MDVFVYADGGETGSGGHDGGVGLGQWKDISAGPGMWKWAQ